jgi:hypothetical protein
MSSAVSRRHASNRRESGCVCGPTLPNGPTEERTLPSRRSSFRFPAIADRTLMRPRKPARLSGLAEPRLESHGSDRAGELPAIAINTLQHAI